MKSIPVLFLIILVLSSCKTYKNITKHETITNDFLASLKPGEKYIFELKNGVRQVVKVTEVKDNTITGLIYEKSSTGKKTWGNFSTTFDGMEKGVVKISILKVNPYLTGVGIFVVVLVTTTIIWVNTAW